MDEQQLSNGYGARPPANSGMARVMVCVGYNPVSQRLIQRAAQIAAALGADLIAIHVQPVESEVPGYQTMLEQNLTLAGLLGAQILIERGAPLAQVLARVAQARGVTHIVMGESARSRMAEVRSGSLVRQILRASRGIDIYIVADPA